MKIVTIEPKNSFPYKVAKRLFPNKEIITVHLISDVFFLLGDDEFSHGIVPIQTHASEFEQETLINLLKYDFFIEKKIKHTEDSISCYSIEKKEKKIKGNVASAFLIFSDPMKAIENQIHTLAKEQKVELLQLKSLKLKEGETPLYFLEVQGHIHNPYLSALFVELNQKFLIKHLGSYHNS